MQNSRTRQGQRCNVLRLNRSRHALAGMTAATITLLGWQASALGAPPINSVNDGRIVQGGTYLNTANSITTFTNTASGGLWVRANTSVRGLESDASGNLTNNGGALHFYAPDNVVRVDGTVNVNALQNGSGAFLGNGGKVFVDAAYLINNGNIYASGVNGGLVQINVAGMTNNATGRIFAHGFGGNGGIISVNSSGPVDIRRGAVLDSSGRVSGDIDTNIINLEGSIVNVEGVLKADGVNAAQVGSRGGTIRLVATGRTDLSELQSAFNAAGQTNPSDAVSTPTLSATEQAALTSRAQTLVTNSEGSVNIGYRTFDSNNVPNGGWLSANGSNGPAANNNDLTENNTQRAGDGGTIIMSADRNVHIRGLVSANGGIGANGSTTSIAQQPNLGVNGGSGGTISLNSNQDIAILNTSGQLSGILQANGGTGGQTTVFQSNSLSNNPSADGGTGGLITFAYNSAMGNRGSISARGGQGGAGPSFGGSVAGIGGYGGSGGLVVFSGNANPIGNGGINDSGGNTGAGVPSTSIGGHAGLIVAPNPNTLRNTQVVIQQDGASADGTGVRVRSTLGQTAGDELLTHAENLIWLRRNSSTAHPADISGILFSNQGTVRSVSDLTGQGGALNTVLGKSPSSSYPYRNFIVGSTASNLFLSLARPMLEEWNGLNSLGSLTVTNNGSVAFPAPPDFWLVRGLGGGHISVLAMGDIGNNEDGFHAQGTMVGGTINLASRRDILTYDLVTTGAGPAPGQAAYHNGSIMIKTDRDLTILSYLGGITANPLIGSTIRLKAGNDFVNSRIINVSAGNPSATGPSLAGLLNIRAANDLRIGNQGFGGPSMMADGVGPNAWGGYVHLKGATISTPSLDYVETNGTVRNGRLVTEGAIQIDPPF